MCVYLQRQKLDDDSPSGVHIVKTLIVTLSPLLFTDVKNKQTAIHKAEQKPDLFPLWLHGALCRSKGASKRNGCLYRAEFYSHIVAGKTDSDICFSAQKRRLGFCCTCSGFGPSVVYQVHCVPVSLCTRPIMYQSHCVPGPLCSLCPNPRLRVRVRV